MKNLSGQRFDMVVAVKPTEKRVKQAVVWECMCDCGNTCYFSTKELREAKFRNCGCEPIAWIKNLKGQVFGQLEVLEITDKRRRHGETQGGSVIWKCMCHACGNECFISSRTLLLNNAKTCGCRGLKPGEAAFNCLITSYKKWARQKKVPWKLTNKQANRLFKSNCYYCGEKPKNISKSRGYTNKEGERIYKEEYIYNGLDEVNPGSGYVTSNVVPCCKKCNEVKLAMTLQEFEEYILRLYTHYFINGGKEKTYNIITEMPDDYYDRREGEAPFNQIYSTYTYHAKKNKGVDWNLTKYQAKALFESNCHYCGIKPSNLSDPKLCKGSFKYNGIDAIENLGGYYIGNVVPCCFKCNKSKRAMTLREWEDYILKLYNYYFVEMKRARNDGL